ncbi:MAG: hypothetical protein DKT66_03615 [Candidatus Melainabacteria bacterium]|nr:MAG: hypothetical protein DKT66_03615 [Candidatus Melainabacteria bacterium]
MRSSNLEYNEKLDHLRLLAFLMVLVYHTYHPVFNWLTKPGGLLSYTDPVNTLSVFVVDGHTGVALFLTLSGFLFARICRKGSFSTKNFYLNRILRIYPLFVFVLLLSIVWGEAANPWPSLFYSLLTLQNMPEALHVELNAHLWTLSCELQFYLLFPILLWLFRCKHGLSLLLLFMGIDVLALSTVWLQDGQVMSLAYGTTWGRINQCIVGMILGFTLDKFESRLRNPLYLLLSVATLSGLLQIGHSCGGTVFGHTQPIWIVYPTLEAIAWSGVIATYVSCSAQFPRGLSRVLAAGGALSYSLYVWHFYFCVILYRTSVPLLLNKSHGLTWLTPLQDWLLAHPFFTAIAFALLVVFPVTLIISIITYNLVEVPFFSLRQRYVFENEQAKKVAVNWTQSILIAISTFKKNITHCSKVAAIAGALILLILACGETVCIAQGKKLDAFTQPDERLGSIYIPGRKIEWSDNEYSTGVLSSAGLRDVEHRTEKPAGVKRILLLGDSMVEGLQIPLSQIVARRLQEEFDAEFDKRIEVINGGHIEYSLGQTVRLYDRLSRDYKPDEVFLVLDNFAVETNCRNCADYSGDSRPYFFVKNNILFEDNMLLPARSYCDCWRFLLQHSRLANWLVNEDLRLQRTSYAYRTVKKECQIAWRGVSATRIAYPNPDRREVRDALLSFLNRVARMQGTKLTVFTMFQPCLDPARKDFEEVKAQSKREFYDVVSLNDALTKAGSKCFSSCGMTQQGHAVVAQTMYDSFVRKNTAIAGNHLKQPEMVE